MNIHDSSLRIRDPRLIILSVLFMVQCLLAVTVHASEKWPGVDEAVVEKYASEHGREAREPLINTDQGDLLLFVFLLAGAVGGFAAGYYWRALVSQRLGRTGGDMGIKT